jgi:hypothetical protein
MRNSLARWNRHSLVTVAFGGWNFLHIPRYARLYWRTEPDPQNVPQEIPGFSAGYGASVYI